MIRVFVNDALILSSAEESVVLWKKAKGDRSPDVASAVWNLAAIMKAMNNPERTIQAFEMVRQIRREAFGDQHPLTAQVQLELARQYAASGQTEEPCALAKASIAALKSCFGTDDPAVREAMQLANP